VRVCMSLYDVCAYMRAAARTMVNLHVCECMSVCMRSVCAACCNKDAISDDDQLVRV
jgi:hypothetical protein